MAPGASSSHPPPPHLPYHPSPPHHYPFPTPQSHSRFTHAHDRQFASRRLLLLGERNRINWNSICGNLSSTYSFKGAFARQGYGRVMGLQPIYISTQVRTHARTHAHARTQACTQTHTAARTRLPYSSRKPGETGNEKHCDS